MQGEVVTNHLDEFISRVNSEVVIVIVSNQVTIHLAELSVRIIAAAAARLSPNLCNPLKIFTGLSKLTPVFLLGTRKHHGRGDGGMGEGYW